MTAIEWPADLVPQTGRFWLQPNTVVSESPLSRAQQVAVRQGDRWVAQMAWQNATQDVAARIDALLARLRGPAGEVTLYDWRRPVPRGTAAAWPGGSIATTWGSGTSWGSGTTWGSVTPPIGAQLRVAAAVGDTALPTWGWMPSQTVLRAGDYVGLGGQLVMVTEDALTDGVGRATLAIAPALRAAADAGTLLTTTRPRARFRLDGNDEAASDASPGPLSSYSISLRESLP
jgi:hypothetical protein